MEDGWEMDLENHPNPKEQPQEAGNSSQKVSIRMNTIQSKDLNMEPRSINIESKQRKSDINFWGKTKLRKKQSSDKRQNSAIFSNT